VDASKSEKGLGAMLGAAGEKDFVYSRGVKRFGYERVANSQKKYVEIPGYGHTDLVMGPNVAQDAYQHILERMTDVEGVIIG